MAKSADTAAQNEQPDGRKQRSVRSREKIKSSIIALIRAGNYTPRAVDISQHSGLSMRTVFRHIDDMESLVREIAADMQKEVLPRFLSPYTTSEWRAQLDEQIERRVEIWEYILPVRLSASLRRFRSKFLMEEYQKVLDLERASLQSVLPKQFSEDKALFAALNQAISVGCWIDLRMDKGLSAKEAEAVVRRMVEALVDSKE